MTSIPEKQPGSNQRPVTSHALAVRELAEIIAAEARWLGIPSDGLLAQAFGRAAGGRAGTVQS